MSGLGNTSKDKPFNPVEVLRAWHTTPEEIYALRVSFPPLVFKPGETPLDTVAWHAGAKAVIDLIEKVTNNA
tara:strand:+ start:71 stop:286 length:216 start_codon:yes stop_codon:yes gene_type:complete